MTPSYNKDLEPEIWQMSFDGKIVVIGLGNPYMKDDGIGIFVARYMKNNQTFRNKIFVFEYVSIDLSLLLQFKGATKIILIDAVRSGNVPGTVSKYRIASRSEPLLELPTLHELQIHDIIDVSERGLLTCPVVVIGVEPEQVSLGEGLSNVVSNSLGRIIEEVGAEVEL